jgi:hypothetical protein
MGSNTSQQNLSGSKAAEEEVDSEEDFYTNDLNTPKLYSNEQLKNSNSEYLSPPLNSQRKNSSAPKAKPKIAPSPLKGRKISNLD